MNTFSKVLLSLPILLTSVVSPALANDTRSVQTSTGKTYTVKRSNVKCHFEPWRRSYIDFQPVGEMMRDFRCSTAGVMTDLVGNRYHYSQTTKICAVQYQGKDWDWYDDSLIKENSLTCAIVRAFQ